MGHWPKAGLQWDRLNDWPSEGKLMKSSASSQISQPLYRPPCDPSGQIQNLERELVQDDKGQMLCSSWRRIFASVQQADLARNKPRAIVESLEKSCQMLS